MVGRQDRTDTPLGLFMAGVKGFLMGSADIVPGVSGGTIALITGIYERLLTALASFDLGLVRLLLRGQFRQAAVRVQLEFLLALLSGIVLAVISMSGLLHQLLQSQRALVYAFFFGLILASVWGVGRRVGQWRGSLVVMLLLGLATGWLVTGLVPFEASHSAYVLFGSGALAISAMLMPGVSGAFLLLILGQYEFVIGLLRDPMHLESLRCLAAFLGGCVLGIAAFSRLLRWWLTHYHSAALAFLSGFMLGAIRSVWPWSTELDAAAPTQVLLAWMLAGSCLVVALVYLAEWRRR